MWWREIVVGAVVTAMHVLSKAYFDAHRNATLRGYSPDMVPDYTLSIDSRESNAILDVGDDATTVDLKEKFENLYARNAECGSPYLLAKIQAAYDFLGGGEASGDAV